MPGESRNDIKIGLEVGIVTKKYQKSGDITEGIVQQILTKSSFHPHGIKVKLETGEIGRVKIIK
ncbi:MAG: YwbE family protein [Bacteroidetes bacterium]|nr:YwbE family protein [Bacteroidota bacterium]